VTAGQDFGPDVPLYGPSGRRQPGGRITCATCHDPHRWTPAGGSGGRSAAAASFLRMGADGYAPLCFPCHAEKSVVSGTDHDLRVTAPKAVNRSGETAEASGICGVCHAVHGASGAFALWNRNLGDGPDILSRSCRSCHRPGNDTGARVPPRPEAHLTNHPGRGLVSRPLTVTRIAVGGEFSLLALYTEEGARGDRGFLSCVSCHDVHRWEPAGNRTGTGVPAEGDLTNSFLRLPGSAAAERTICAECHAETSLQYYRNYHFPEGR
jgi:hypothetical protein